MSDFSVIWQHETESTNRDAFISRDDYPDKTVWAAEYQSAGRGQRGNVWRSERSENLMFSILLKPESIDASHQFLISEAASVAMVGYLSSRGIDARIKWPNDIYVGDRKICGMLIEHVISGTGLSASVVGIGLNVMQDIFPSDLPNPTSVSLCLGGGVTFDLKEELARYMSVFCGIYDALGDQASAEKLTGQYTSLLYRRGEWHSYIERTPDGQEDVACIKGCIIGVDPETSCLMLRTGYGEVKTYAFKEIAFVL